eukprot:27944_1
MIFSLACRLRTRTTALQTPHFCSNYVEEWRDIPNCSNYQVSSLGKVYNKKFDRLFNVNYETFKKPGRRVQVILTTDQGRKGRFYISRLILLSFDPIPNSNQFQANHIDGDCYNNTLPNLNWMSPSENLKHAHTFHVKHSGTPVELIHETNKEKLAFSSITRCAQYIDLPQNRVSVLCAKQKTFYGYHFRYANPDKYNKYITNLVGEEWKQWQSGRRGQSYFISNCGRVKIKYQHCDRLKQMPTIQGYKYVTMPKHSMLVHRLVATYFVANPNGYNIVDNVDGD